MTPKVQIEAGEGVYQTLYRELATTLKDSGFEIDIEWRRRPYTHPHVDVRICGWPRESKGELTCLCEALKEAIQGAGGQTNGIVLNSHP